MKNKLDMLGSNGARVLVGGKADDSDEDAAALASEEKKSKTRDKNDVEPLCFHSPPVSLLHELLHSYDCAAVIANGGDGRLAACCLQRRIPCFLLCYSPEHEKALEQRVQKLCFQAMLNEDSKIYDAKLAQIMSKEAALEDEEEDDKKGGGKGGKKGGSKGGGKGGGRGGQKGGGKGGQKGGGKGGGKDGQKGGGKDGQKGGGKDGQADEGGGQSDADMLKQIQELAKQAASG